MSSGEVLNVRNLSKDYGRAIKAISELDISVKKHEFVCIIGPNGCGKSTLLKVVAGINKPSSGTCRINGRISYMPQSPSLLPWRTVRDNLRLPAQISGKSAEKRSDNLLKEFGLNGFAGFYPHALSGGMQQKTALIRAVLPKPGLLLLDEPFSALDAITRRELQQWLIGLWQKDRPAVVCVTHDVREAILLADTIYVMSSRPGSIREKIEVNLPRANRSRLIYSEKAKQLEKRLSGLLEAKA